jgi:MFS family permease
MSAAQLVQLTQRRSTLPLIGMGFATLLITGLPGSALGVAWPSIRASFHIPLDALGALLIAQMVGGLLSSLNSGRLIAALGMGRSLAIGMAVYTGGIFGYVLAPAWWTIVLCGLVGGLGSGLVGASTNTYFATRHGPSLMVWLHACFGLGSALGPAIATLLLAGGLPDPPRLSLTHVGRCPGTPLPGAKPLLPTQNHCSCAPCRITSTGRRRRFPRRLPAAVPRRAAAAGQRAFCTLD